VWSEGHKRFESDAAVKGRLSWRRSATRGRTALAVRVLDPREATFPFKGPVRLRATESGSVTEADAARVRRAYLENLETIATSWNDRLVAHGGALVRATTTDDPVAILRSILLAIRRGRP
jgi:hypothetical protein